MEPVIDFVEQKEEPKPELVSVPKKPILVYKPTSFNPQQIKDPSSFNIQIKKKWILYLLIIIGILGIGIVGFLLGKFI